MQALQLIAAFLVAILAACQASQDTQTLDPEKPTLAAVIANSDHYPGLLDSYRDRKTGDLYLVVRPEQLDKTYLYFATFMDGNSDTGTQRGIHASQRIIRLERDFDRLQVQQLNTQFYFDPDSALARAADANLPPAVLAAAEIAEEGADGELLVKANEIFLTEALQQIKPAADPEADAASTFVLGDLNAERTRLESIRAYPLNMDLVVNYVYANPAPLARGASPVTDSRFVSIRLQHSLVEAPDEAFEPRFEDPRVGYFTNRITDMTDPGPVPFRDPINRWKLVKKEPGAALSEPVEPLVFWLENTTPVEFRDVVTDAVLVWNEAFEKAGFRDAIEVRVQPDDADWDAGDLRYNVLRWTSSPESTWGGYGPSVSDPRTGQIIGADIMLEFGWLSTFLQREDSFSEQMLPPLSAAHTHGRHCAAGEVRKSQLMLGRALLAARGNSAAESELVRQSIYDLVTHEVGHTLGLTHNFRATHFTPTEDLQNPGSLDPMAVAASVMDYPAVNYAPAAAGAPSYFLLVPGLYDHWAIEFGYSEALADDAEEAARLEGILSRSNEPGLALAVHADVMAISNNGIDPRAMWFDQSSDPLEYASRRIDLVGVAASTLLERFSREGESWQALYNAYMSLSSEMARQFVVASRWIGGVYVDRSMQGQPGEDIPLRPVELAKQKQAMALLRDRLFSPDADSFSRDIYQHLQERRRGDGHYWYRPKDPQIHGRALAVQKRVLGHLLHPTTMTRINDSGLYGNEYALAEVLADLTDAIFAGDIVGSVTTLRQQLQREYVEQLLVAADPAGGSEHDNISRGVALYQLTQIQTQMQLQQGRGESPDLSTRAHRAALLHRIQTALYPGAQSS